MHNIGEALQLPVKNLAQHATELTTPEHRQLANEAQTIVRLVDEIQLLNMLETDVWKTNVAQFSIQSLIDEVALAMLPIIKRKGLQLLINNQLPADEERHGDREALRKILELLLHYSVTTTQIGKITLEITEEESTNDRLLFRILDTGEGISNDEIDNLHFPFLNETSEDRYGKAYGLTFYLCDQLSRKLGGHLNIKTRTDIGTRYNLHVKWPRSRSRRSRMKNCLMKW